MSVDGGFADVMELLSRAAECLDELEALDPGQQGSAALSGGTPTATENRAIHVARSRISRDRARGVRGNLDRIRAEARKMAAEARRVGTRTPGERTSPGGWDGGGAVLAGGGGCVESPVQRFRPTLEAMKQTDDGDEVCRLVASAVRDGVPGVAAAGVCRSPAGGPGAADALEVVAGDTALVEVVDVENATGRGPCRQAVAGEVVVSPDLAADGRWPDVAVEAGRRGWRGVLVCPYVERSEKHRGALVAYSRSAEGFGRADREALEYLAELTGVALAGARRVSGLIGALESRDVIGQAKGMLMQRDGLDAEQAFAGLVEASQHANMKLRDVAAWLVETGGTARRAR